MQRRAIAAIKKHGGVRKAARAKKCNHGVIIMARDGDDFPKAREVFGLPPATVTVPPDMVKKRKPSKRSRTRIRSAVHHGYGDEGRAHRERMRTWLAGMGYESLTEYVEAQIDAI